MTELQPLTNAINELRTTAIETTEQLQSACGITEYTWTVGQNQSPLLPEPSADHIYLPGSWVDYRKDPRIDQVQIYARIHMPLAPGTTPPRRHGKVLPYALHFLKANDHDQRALLTSTVTPNDPNITPYFQGNYGEHEQLTIHAAPGDLQLVLSNDVTSQPVDDFPEEVAEKRIETFIGIAKSTQQIFARIALLAPHLTRDMTFWNESNFY